MRRTNATLVLRWIAIALVGIGCGATTAPVETAPPDSDHDGIVDAQDLCPCEAEDADGSRDEDGCPDWDDDGDGVSDACDACPREAETANGVCDEDGCPDLPSAQVDTSANLLERVEFAPGSAAIRPEDSTVLDDVVRAMNGHPERGPLHVLGQIDAHEPHHEGLAMARAQAVVTELARRGVDAARMIAEMDPTFVTSDPHTLPRYVRFEVPQPLASPSPPSVCRPALCTTPWTRPTPVCGTPSVPDRDGDGLDDARDQCPCIAEDHDGWQDDDGCPDPDNDGDHIPDVCDLCPNDPETYQGNCDEDGCPDRSHICVQETGIRIVQVVAFARGSARPASDSSSTLDAIAAVLDGHPELTLVAVLGESDAHEPHHATLPLARAQAVLEALVTRGVARERLVAEASTFVHAPSDPADASRRVWLEIRQPVAPVPSEGGGCARTPCEVPVCNPPPPTPPAC